MFCSKEEAGTQAGWLVVQGGSEVKWKKTSSPLTFEPWQFMAVIMGPFAMDIWLFNFIIDYGRACAGCGKAVPRGGFPTHDIHRQDLRKTLAIEYWDGLILDSFPSHGNSGENMNIKATIYDLQYMINAAETNMLKAYKDNDFQVWFMKDWKYISGAGSTFWPCRPWHGWTCYCRPGHHQHHQHHRHHHQHHHHQHATSDPQGCLPWGFETSVRIFEAPSGSWTYRS